MAEQSPEITPISQKQTKLTLLENELSQVDQQIIDLKKNNNKPIHDTLRDKIQLFMLLKRKLDLLNSIEKNEVSSITSKMHKVSKFETKTETQKTKTETKMIEMQQKINDISSQYFALKEPVINEILEIDSILKPLDESRRLNNIIVPSELILSDIAPELDLEEYEDEEKETIIKGIKQIVDSINTLMSKLESTTVDSTKNTIKLRIINSVDSLKENIEHLNQLDNKTMMIEIERVKTKLEKSERSEKDKHEDLRKKAETELTQMSRTRNKNKTQNEGLVKSKKNMNKNVKDSKSSIIFTVNTPLESITETTNFIVSTENKKNIKFTYDPSTKKIKITHEKYSETIPIVSSLPTGINKSIKDLHTNLIKSNITKYVEDSVIFFNNFINNINTKIGLIAFEPLSMELLKTPQCVATINILWNYFTKVCEIVKSSNPNTMVLSNFFYYYLQGHKHMKNIQMYIDSLHPTGHVVLPELLSEATGTNNIETMGKYTDRLLELKRLKTNHNAATNNKRTQKTLKTQMDKIKKGLLKNITKNMTNRNEKIKYIARKTRQQINSYSNI